MQIRVDLGGWEHQCYGDSYDINAIVTLELFLPMSGSLDGNADFMESHHDLLVGGLSVTGRIVEVEVLGPQNEFVEVTRLPSSTAIRGLDDDDRGDIIDLATGELLSNEPSEFIIVLDVANGTALPTERAIAPKQ